MEIIEIFPPYIYSIQYAGRDDNEYDRLLYEWNDLEYLSEFFETNKYYLETTTWTKVATPELAVNQVLEEAEWIETTFEKLYENAKVGEKPDFDSQFRNFGGDYDYVLEYRPVKSYGNANPSLLRIYAIKMGDNTYIITGGGIKLGRSIQDSPELKDHAIQDINSVRSWLRSQGIIDKDDL